MNILLDTNIFLRIAGNDDYLPTAAKKLIEEPSNQIYLSSVSAWEIAIKWSKGRLGLPEQPRTLIENIADAAGFVKVSVNFSDAHVVSELPVFEDHKDPFDRLLIAQAMNRGLSLMTSDKKFKQYDIDILLYGKK